MYVLFVQPHTKCKHGNRNHTVIKFRPFDRDDSEWDIMVLIVAAHEFIMWIKTKGLILHDCQTCWSCHVRVRLRMSVKLKLILRMSNRSKSIQYSKPSDHHWFITSVFPVVVVTVKQSSWTWCGSGGFNCTKWGRLGQHSVCYCCWFLHQTQLWLNLSSTPDRAPPEELEGRLGLQPCSALEGEIILYPASRSQGLRLKGLRQWRIWGGGGGPGASSL